MQFERPDPMQSVATAAPPEAEVQPEPMQPAGGVEATGPDSPATGAPAATTDKPKLPLLPWEDVRGEIIRVLRSIYDPEIPVNIYDLGLIYGIDRNDEGEVVVRMTLTSPACPVAESLPPMVTMRVASVPGVVAAGVDLVWEPPWDPSRMTEAARLELGLM
jgi:FeS assembly SUF system protein